MTETNDRPSPSETRAKHGPDGRIVDPGPPVRRYNVRDGNDFQSGGTNHSMPPARDPNSRNQPVFRRGLRDTGSNPKVGEQ
jgi:hypothetical protein